MKDELARATMKSTRAGALFDSKCDQVVAQRADLAAKDAAINSVIQASWAPLGSSTIDLLENFPVVLNKSVGNTSRLGSLDTRFHAGTAIDGVTLHFSGDAMSDKGASSNKGEVGIDLGSKTEVVAL